LIRSALSVAPIGGKDSPPTAEEVYRHILNRTAKPRRERPPESSCDVFEAIAAIGKEKK